MKFVRVLRGCCQSLPVFRPFLLLLALSLPAGTVSAQQDSLPTFGGVGGGLISDRMEKDIGQQVLQSIRRSSRQLRDPLVNNYLESIVYRLIPSVSMQDRRVALVIIDSPALNAFAVPGNIVGVNGGLFLNAKTEQQFASVIAHELAHLSQRHFARRLEQQEANTPLTIAGLIAGIVLAAATGSDAGIATIMGTQAFAAQNMLQYSRSNEQEADRVGLDIMADAGMDPRGMPEMFEIMMRKNRLQGNQLPEYLSTHPLSQSRVSDTRSRAEQYPRRGVSDGLEYHLMRARLQVHYSRTPDDAVRLFANYIEQASGDEAATARYALAVAYLAAGKPVKAEELLRRLLDGQSGRITYQVTLGEALIDQDRSDAARTLLKNALSRNPRNVPIISMLARAELEAGNAVQAADHLRSLTREKPDREDYWLRLAEAEGQARDIVGVHRARAEFDILVGDLESARRQLQQAQEKISPNTPGRHIINERLLEVSEALRRR
ncbi:MAG: M48 family metallopeptidase [Oleiphilaceae bacterium]|nr:M48 family metallopeptidase [Oleiphilaceae bacterium]